MYYGAKIRLPHATVMTFLFKEGSLRSKLQAIATLTLQHSTNLGKFALIYKTFTKLSIVFAEDKNLKPLFAFLAGTVGGFVVFGADNAVNQQIILYLFSRVMFALGKVVYGRLSTGTWLPPKLSLTASASGSSGGASEKLQSSSSPLDKAIQAYAWPVFAAVIWGGVMTLFEFTPNALVPSLEKTMEFIYHDGESAEYTWKDFVPIPFLL